ncbi:MAG: GNAT family N-acetyltransferase [Pseudomonadota bacterium]
MILRAATASDAPACAAILSDWIAQTPWFPDLHSRAEDLDFVRRKLAHGEATVAEQETVAGFTVLEGDYLACLYVATAARGRGVGARLLRAAQAARPGGFRLWTFQANTHARRFYAKAGLVARRFTNGAENEEGLPDVEFVWPGTPGA